MAGGQVCRGLSRHLSVSRGLQRSATASSTFSPLSSTSISRQEIDHPSNSMRCRRPAVARTFHFSSASSSSAHVTDVTRIIEQVPKLAAPSVTGKRGVDVLHDPLFNKGSAYNNSERERLGLRGLVPPRCLSIEEQKRKLYQSFLDRSGDPVAQNQLLTSLHDRNETLFYRLIIDHIEEMAPIIYTPTVGIVCEKFANMFRRPRGMYFSVEDRGLFGTMVHNWPVNDVQVIVVTDGSRILGLGDLGANGMGIPIGKLSLYVAAGGIDPGKVLPVMLDVGTNNEKLLKDSNYLGVNRKRGSEEEFYGVVDEFMRAVRQRWPKALVQFEDFSSDHAADVLHAYRLKQLCFNDDIQGTGATVLAGVLSACRQTGTPLSQQRVVVLGAGSAGLGVATTLLQGMCHEGLSTEEAQSRFWVLDQHGLLVRSRSGMNDGQHFFSRGDWSEGAGKDLLSVVKEVKPTCILGLSASAKAFSEEVIREMAKHVERPIVFPLSNPTSVAECTAEEAFKWTDNRAVFAAGSPFPPLEINGQLLQPSQCNNMFIFPGVGLGSVLCEASRATDKMFYAAAKALAETVTDEEMARGQVFPAVGNIRSVSLKVASAVMKTAIMDGIAKFTPAIRKGKTLDDYISHKMYDPAYRPLVEGRK